MIGNHYRRVGSFESTAQTDSEVDVAAAYMDLDTAGTFVRFGAKGPGSLGVKIRTLNAGAAVNAIAAAADGTMTFAKGHIVTSGTTQMQAATCTTMAGTGALSGFTTLVLSSTFSRTTWASGNTGIDFTSVGTNDIRLVHVGSTGADTYVGVASSVGGNLVTGSAAYSVEFRNDIGFYFGIGATKTVSITGAGLQVVGSISTSAGLLTTSGSQSVTTSAAVYTVPAEAGSWLVTAWTGGSSAAASAIVTLSGAGGATAFLAFSQNSGGGLSITIGGTNSRDVTVNQTGTNTIHWSVVRLSASF